MFSVESHFTPLWRPEKADRTKAADSDTMITSWTPVVFSTSAVRFSPSATWRAPSPRLVAVPNTVANTASRSIALPGQDSARRAPIRGTKAELSRLPRPLRKPAYARARPVMP